MEINGQIIEYSPTTFRVVEAIKELLKINTKDILLINHEDEEIHITEGRLTQILTKLKSLRIGIRSVIICKNGQADWQYGEAISACGCEKKFADIFEVVEIGCDNHIVYVNDKVKLTKFIDKYLTKYATNANHVPHVSSNNAVLQLASKLPNTGKYKQLKKMILLLIENENVSSYNLGKCLNKCSSLTMKKYLTIKMYRNKVKNCLKTLREKLKPLGYTIKSAKGFSHLSLLGK